MTAAEWSVLITVEQASDQEPITEDQRSGILDRLPGGEKWLQYPPASGRGHGFETRWWETGDDAGAVGPVATNRFLEAVDAVDLRGVEIVLVHIASAGDRLNEAVIGLERRQGTDFAQTDWSVMLRAVPDVADRPVPPSSVAAIVDRLRPDAMGTGRDGLIEVRFWVVADDAVAASSIGATRFRDAMSELGLGGWTIVRDHTASVAEMTRAAYIGVERRVLSVDAASLPVVIRL